MCQNSRPHDHHPHHDTPRDHEHSHGDGHTHSHTHSHSHGADLAAISRRVFLSGIAAALATRTLLAQSDDAAKAERFTEMSKELRAIGLSQPFKGITTNGELVSGLFPIQRTGIPTDAVRVAAERLLSTLTADQRAKVMFPVDDPQWSNWANQHWYNRAGVALKDMTEDQREAVYNLIKVSLSPRGYEQIRNIMRLNETLAEMTDDHVFVGEFFYNVTILGKPSATEPWGWQFQGHHGLINYFILGDQVVMTPQFIGGEPVIAEQGKYKGTMILQAEQKNALEFVNSLDGDARAKAILKNSKKQDMNVAEAFKDNIVLDYAGVPVSSLPGARRDALMDLTELYIGNMDEGRARLKMQEIKSRINETHFAWIGSTGPDAVFYYRIQSPVILIEFDHQRPRSLSKFLDPNVPSPLHIHCVVRTPNGNDYGKDLLREHYKQHSHA